MKKSHILIVAVLIFVPGCKTLEPWDVVKFSAGALTACVIHEGAHKVVSQEQGNRISFDGLTWQSERPASDSFKMAGLTANALNAEIIIQAAPDRRERDPFWTGLLWASVFEAITYPMLDDNGGDFRGDIGHKTLFQFGFTFHSLSVLWREFR